MSKRVKCARCGREVPERDTDGWFELDAFSLLETVVESEPARVVAQEFYTAQRGRNFCSRKCLLHFLKLVVEDSLLEENDEG